MFTVVIKYARDILHRDEPSFFYIDSAASQSGATSVSYAYETPDGRLDIKAGLVAVTTATFTDGRFGEFIDRVRTLLNRYTDEKRASDKPGQPAVEPPVTGREYSIDVLTIKGSCGSQPNN